MTKPTTTATAGTMPEAKTHQKPGQLATDIASGDLPSTQDINVALEKAKDTLKGTNAESLGEKGQKVVSDATAVISSAQRFLSEKNKNDELQQLIKESRELGREVLPQARQEAERVFNKAAQDVGTPDMSDAMEGAKDVALELLYSKELRSILVEAIALLQDAFVGIMQTTTMKIRAQEGLGEMQKKIDQIPDQPGSMKRRQDIEKGVEQFQEKVKEVTQQGKPKLEQMAKEGVEKARQTGEQTLEKARQVGEQTLEKAKQIGQELQTDVQKTLQDVNAEERSRRILDRFNMLLKRLSKNPKLKNSFQSIINMVEPLADEAVHMSDRMSERVKHSEHAKKMSMLVRKLLERFSGPKSLDNFVDALRNASLRLQEDKDLREFLRDCRDYLNQIFDKPELLTENAMMERGKALFERGQALFTNELPNKQALSRVLDEGRRFIDRLQNDRATQKLLDDLNRFVSNFVRKDASGRMQLDLDMFLQMRSVLVSLVLDQIDFIPLFIEGSDDTYDYHFDNICLSVRDLVPDNIKVDIRQKLNLDIKSLSAENATSSIKLKIDGLQTQLKDVHFWFRRKTIPAIEDEGYADIALLGNGISLNVQLEGQYNQTTQRPSFLTTSVGCTIDKLDLHIHEARHNWLLAIITTLFSSSIKHRLEQMITDAVFDSAMSFTATFNTLLESFNLDTMTANISSLRDTLSIGSTSDTSSKLSEKAEQAKQWMNEKKEDAMDWAQEKAEAIKRT